MPIFPSDSGMLLIIPMTDSSGEPDFNDLLFEFHRMKDKNTYDYVFVDELQDVNDIESRIAMSTGNVKFFSGRQETVHIWIPGRGTVSF